MDKETQHWFLIIDKLTAASCCPSWPAKRAAFCRRLAFCSFAASSCCLMWGSSSKVGSLNPGSTFTSCSTHCQTSQVHGLQHA